MVKKKEYITNDIEIPSDSDIEHSDEENSNEEILMKKNWKKEIKHRMPLFLCLKHFEWFKLFI